MGFTAVDTIEPVDGFHPSQLANYIASEIMWPQVLQEHPDWFGPINPNNDLIDQLFPEEEPQMKKK